MIINVYRYNRARNISIEKPNQREWVPTYLCENPSNSSPKESVPDLRNLAFILYIIVVWWFYTYTVFTGVLSDVPGYESSIVMISAQICT